MAEYLSPLEAMMWELGHDPAMRTTIGFLTILDRAPTHAELVDRAASAVAAAPRLTQRPRTQGLVRRRPAWVDDRDFDAAEHVRSVSIAESDDRRSMFDLLALLEVAPFDPDRSPWDATLIQGIEGGRAALYVRGHHVLTDGRGGVSLIELLLDERPAKSRTSSGRSERWAGNGVGRDRPDRTRSHTATVDLASVVRPVTSTVTTALSEGPFKALARGTQQTLDLASSISRQVVVTGDRLSPLPAVRAVRTYFDALSVPGARSAARALGGSRNDLLVASAAAALGRYHRQLGYACDELRLSMAISRNRDADAQGNWFAPTRVVVPALERPLATHFGVVADRIGRARREPAVRVAPALASAISHVPRRVLLPLLQAQAHMVDFAATSLPGLRGRRRICGAVIEEAYPFGPRLGCLVNLTAFGTEDRLDVGIALDPAGVAEPALLVECLTEAFAAFAPTPRRPIDRDGLSTRVAPADVRHVAGPTYTTG